MNWTTTKPLPLGDLRTTAEQSPAGMASLNVLHLLDMKVNDPSFNATYQWHLDVWTDILRAKALLTIEQASLNG